jgi:hypothetical protein
MKVTHASMPHAANAADKNLKQQEVKVFTVEPPDTDDEIFDKQMALMEKAIEEAPPPPDDPILKTELNKKMAFEKLMFLSKDSYKEIEFSGLLFKFKVLKSNDNAKILSVLIKSNIDETYKASVMGLAASIVSVNEIPFENFYTGDPKIVDPLVRKYSELSNWPAFMVTSLMSLSNGVQFEMEKEFNRDFLK